jgi:hypothetical protein
VRRVPSRACIASHRSFGNDINSKSQSHSVGVQACEQGEAFDTTELVCTCAEGFGLVLADSTCRLCTADEIIPAGSKSCATCPVLSSPNADGVCECFPGYSGTIFGAFACARARVAAFACRALLTALRWHVRAQV